MKISFCEAMKQSSLCKALDEVNYQETDDGFTFDIDKSKLEV